MKMTISHLKKTGLRSVFATALLVSGILTMAAAYGTEPPKNEGVFQADTRGFGNVEVTLRTLGDKKDASWTTFAAQDAEHAKVIGSKRLADLLGFGDIKPVTDSKLPGTVLALDGAGGWILGLDGTKFQELFAPSMKALAKAATESGADSWKPVPDRAHPRWLDGFDNAGPAIWYGSGGAPVDIDSEFPWMKERGLAYNFSFPIEIQYVAPGVFDTSLTDWFGAMCKRYGIPFRSNYAEIGKPSWYWNREPLPYVKATPGYLAPTFEKEREVQSRIPYGSEPISSSDPFTHDARMRFMASVKQDPNFLGTMAVAEIGKSGVRLLGPVAEMPETQSAWHNYLFGELGFDLPKLGLAHHGRRDFYRDWSEVKVPTSRDFLGFDHTSVDLAGAGWEGVADYDIENYAEFAKAGAAPSPKPIPEKGWVAVRSNDPMLLTYKGKQHSAAKFVDYWLRRDVTVAAGQLEDLKYLHVERPDWRSKYCDAFLNGQPLKMVTSDRYEELTVCFELGDALRTGANQLVLRMEGCPPIGFVTLGKLPLRPYPEMSKPENRRWYDASNFVTWLRMRGVEQILQAARTAEPDRPLKMMALINHMDMAIPLAERYGAYVHDTGAAGGFWCPFTGARIARAHGLPWSCEQGGPPKDAASIQSQMTFYLMYGNDALDLVFATTHYKDTPGVKEWFDQNLNLVKCIGKMHLPTPPIGLLFSARNLRLGFNEPMNWHIGRGALQGVGRNFAQIETPDLNSDIIDQFPVVFDCGTVQMTQQEVDAIRRYVERGGIFVAQHHTARHLPDTADAWPLAASLGLKVTPKWMSNENFNRWADAEIRFGADQDLLPSLRGKTIHGSGVAIDWLGNENSGGVSYKPLDGQRANVRPVATWADDGSMAVVEAKLGRGKIILLGSIFFTRMRDDKGTWVNDADRGKLLDEFLATLGVPRDSWTNDRSMWAELWRSKNGVYDLYPVARMTQQSKVEPSFNAEVSLRRPMPLKELVEVSTLGHPKVKVAWKDGKFTLPETDYAPMQSRVFIAPRAEIARAGLDWFKAQSRIWRELPLLPDTAKPQPIPVPADVIPAVDDWQMTLDGKAAEAKDVKLGSFAAMGVAEDAKAQFRKTIDIPAVWQGRRVNLCFKAGTRRHGVIPQGKLWINGQEAVANKKPLLPGTEDFTLDVTEQAKSGKVELALEIDGSKPQRDKEGRRPRPSGITGIFYLEAIAPAVTTTPLDGPWFAAADVGVLTPVKKGEKVTYTYLETKFTLPKERPAKRLFLERPDGEPIQHIVLNDKAITVPMPRLDISGLVKPDGKNVLRWVPGAPQFPEITRKQAMPIPDLNLVWTE